MLDTDIYYEQNYKQTELEQLRCENNKLKKALLVIKQQKHSRVKEFADELVNTANRYYGTVTVADIENILERFLK